MNHNKSSTPSTLDPLIHPFFTSQYLPTLTLIQPSQVSAIKTYITNIVEVLISQHAVVSILVEKVSAAAVNGTGNGNGGESVNSTSSFIASYTGQSIAGGNGTGGVITTYVPSLSFFPIFFFTRWV